MILAIITDAQREVAKAAAEYVPTVLAQTGLPDSPVGEFRPESLVGVASDGRRLDTLAYGAVTTAKTGVGGGAATRQALAEGGSWLAMMTALQVADAARQAVGVMTAARPKLAGQIRVLNPPSCQRCVILAGRWYRWDAGFPRHPRCDCTGMPTEDLGWARAEGFITDPMDAYRRGEITDLTEAQVKAIEDGANIGQVVNAYRGISTTATQTRDRVLRKVRHVELPPGVPDLAAFFPDRFRETVRARNLTPEGIYRQARSRDEAISLLRKYGYIT